MNILLINDNPVVTKLVTLSAQKTGDTLEIVNAVEQIDAQAYDLLIFDNELFDPALYDALVSEVSFAKKLYMGSRGVDKPDAFDMIVNKPFLPTDLVDLFTDISHELECAPSEEEPLFEETLLTEEEIDLDTLDDEEIDLESAIEALDDEEEIDLDSAIEALSDDESESDLEVEPLLEDMDDLEISLDAEDDMTEVLEATPEAEESILDKDDLEEVQALLEEEESEAPLESDSISLDDEEVLPETPTAEAIEEEREAEDILEDTPLDEETDAMEAESSTEEVLHDEAVEDDALSLLEESLEDAVENLSEEELNAPVDEEMLLDIVNDESSAFDEFDALDINAVRSALGETGDEAVMEDQCDRDALEQVEEQLLSQEPDETVSQSTVSDPKNGIEALQAVLSALQNEEVAQSLKAMNITINISFGEQ